ncbi:putative LRR receptor-like serine/threonine-protein kinase [Cinnamomum micranthum f. kanehirae]|uniref:Putative LRR receptor-like serine/threonine-protein kinase n=1 Tax=Cinnamomum micranthum f. kanehirae TaxID=337451 RepID=A0A3S3QXK2_9MAGN|nr:putative LRR receptor-like serine/threonine-protein kinase [Cinnamomum micranthum f. kanehirae]
MTAAKVNGQNQPSHARVNHYYCTNNSPNTHIAHLHHPYLRTPIHISLPPHAKMRRTIPSPPPLLLIQAAALLLLFLSSSASSATCPYDFPAASILIPSACYANYSSSSSAPPTNCCQYVFAAYIFSAIRYSNLSGAAFLPSPTAATCSNAFANYLLRHGLVRPSLIRTSDQCNLNGDPDQFAAGKRACQYSAVSAIRSAVNLSSGIHLCTAVRRDLLYDQPSCTACQNSVIASTMSLLKTTASKEFVPCGMATTIGIWSSDPEIGRFRSFFLCIVQVLDNVGSLSTSNLVPSPPLTTTNKTTLPRSRSSNKARVIASATAAGSGILFIAILATVFLAIRRWKRKKLSLDESKSTGDQTARIASQLPTEGLYVFTKSELKHATNGFHPSLVLGEGGAGKVYLGKLPSGQHVAVKRISQKKKIDEFYRELEILAKLRHRNLTTLVGYCLQRKEHVLVYEYMSGGNLGHALHHGELTWPRRVQIAVDIAEGLAYLHEFPDGAVVHRDVKPTNILLNESGSAKLSDFGVSQDPAVRNQPRVHGCDPRDEGVRGSGELLGGTRVRGDGRVQLWDRAAGADIGDEGGGPHAFWWGSVDRVQRARVNDGGRGRRGAGRVEDCGPAARAGGGAGLGDGGVQGGVPMREAVQEREAEDEGGAGGVEEGGSGDGRDGGGGVHGRSGDGGAHRSG